MGSKLKRALNKSKFVWIVVALVVVVAIGVEWFMGLV